MKKFIITIMAIVMVMSLASCTEHSVSKTVSAGSTEVYVTEQTIKNDEVIEESHYVITYETAEEAWAAVNG